MINLLASTLEAHDYVKLWPNFLDLSISCLSGDYWWPTSAKLHQKPHQSINAHCLYFIGLCSQIFKNEPKMIVLLLIVVLPKESQRNVGSGMNITTNITSWLHEDNLLCFLIAHRGVHNARKRRPSL